MNKKTKGMLIAAAAAGLFGTAAIAHAGSATVQTAGDSGKVRCHGINSCKGQSACHSADNACAGHNACKGKGWLETSSEQECKDKGGTVLKDS